MYYVIYKITNRVNGKIYIGCHITNNLNDGYMGSGKNIKQAIEKYGTENFEKEYILFCDDRKEMYEKESEIVNEKFVLNENTYNISVGGKGGSTSNTNFFRGKTFSSETKEKRSHIMSSIMQNMSQKERKRINNKIKNTQQENNHDHKTFKNRIHTDDTKNKMRESHKGKHDGNKNSQYGTMWITNGVDNKKIKKNVDTIPDGWYKGRTSP